MIASGYEVPISIIRSKRLHIATYTPSSFIPQSIKARSRKVYGPSILIALLTVAAFWLAATVANADTIGINNQATLVRVSDKVQFGVQQPEHINDEIRTALERLAAITNARFASATNRVRYEVPVGSYENADVSLRNVDWAHVRVHVNDIR